MAFDPSIDDYDRDPINVDEFGLGDTDRKALSDILMSKGPRAAREALERHFGASFADIQHEVEESKRFEARVEKMTEALKRFQIHYPLWLNTERNQNTLLSFLKQKGLKDFNYRVLSLMWEELAHIDGKLDLDETKPANARLYVGQNVPGAEFDTDSGYMPRKSISQMTATEFAQALARSSKFRARIDGTEQ
jgi:hypothetical protein